MENNGSEHRSLERYLEIALWAVVIFLAFSRFIHLGHGDLKDWDECLYAWRAKLVVMRGDWLDQSELAWAGYDPASDTWSGFYSAAFPPLQVWFTALMFKLFGYTEFAARIWSALAGAGTVIVLFLLGRRMGRNRWSGFFAALLMASVWYFTVYSRRSQFDVPYTFWICASLYGYVRYMDCLRIVGRRDLETDRGFWWWLVFAGVCLGLGLMNKIVLALMAPIVMGSVSLYAWLQARHRFSFIVIEQAIVNGVALAVIAPWHLAMTLSEKGGEFWYWYIQYHLLGRAGETLDAHQGPWYYYFMQFWEKTPEALLALVLLSIPVFLYVIVLSFFRPDMAIDDSTLSEDEEDRERPWRWRDTRHVLPLVWIGFQFLLFSSSETKREPYTIPMFPPLALLAGLFLGERIRDRRRLKLLAVTLAIVTGFCLLNRMKTYTDNLEIVSSILASGEARVLRDGGEHSYFRQENLAEGDVLRAYLPLVALFTGLLAATLILYFVLRHRRGVFYYTAVSAILLFVVIFSLREVRNVFDPEKATRRFGWQEIRPYINSMDFDYLVFAGAYGHPGAMYYLNGLNQNDWHDRVDFIPFGEYDAEKLAGIDPAAETRVVIMKSHLRDNWTEEERRALLDRLRLLAEGEDLAIYELKDRQSGSGE